MKLHDQMPAAPAPYGAAFVTTFYHARLLHDILQDVCVRELAISPWSDVRNADFWRPMTARFLTAAITATLFEDVEKEIALADVYEFLGHSRGHVINKIAGVYNFECPHGGKPLFQLACRIVAQEMRACDLRHRDYIFFEAVSLLGLLARRYDESAAILKWALREKRPSGFAPMIDDLHDEMLQHPTSFAHTGPDVGGAAIERSREAQ